MTDTNAVWCPTCRKVTVTERRKGQPVCALCGTPVVTESPAGKEPMADPNTGLRVD